MSFSNNGQILFDDCGVKISEPQMDDLRVGFESRLKLRFYDSKVTTDAGVLSWKFLPCTLILRPSIVAISQDFVIPASFQQLRDRTCLALRCQIYGFPLVNIGLYDPRLALGFAGLGWFAC